MRKQRKHNPIAKNLRTPLYRKRVVESKKVYNRKKRIRGGSLELLPLFCFYQAYQLSHT